jgi:hypothetical protein
VIAAAALAAGAGLFIAAGLAWTAHLLRIGTLDALELAGKVGTPEPCSAVDWPQMRMRAAITQNGSDDTQDGGDEPELALLLVEWPAHSGCESTVLVDLGADARSAARLLGQWCADRAPISPSWGASRGADLDIVLRRRQSLDHVRCRLIAEDYHDRAPSQV